MSLSTLFGFGLGSEVSWQELPNIFPMPIEQDLFVRIDIIAIYSKILIDTLERTHGLNDDQVALLWDNCVKSNSTDGLITMLAKSMADKLDLYIVFEKAVNVVRHATAEEQAKIKADYESQAKSSVGVYISFKNFRRSDLVKFYLGLEYCTVGSLHKSMNLSKALQVKISDLRGSVNLSDSAAAKAQAKGIATALSQGKDVLLDAKDTIETNKPDLTAVDAAIDFLIQKMCFYLGMPDSYLSGEQTGGMGTSGENDMRAVERGLKAYFFSIVKPTVEALFGVKVSYKTQDFRNITAAMEVLKVFTLVDSELISSENKLKIINQLMDLPENAVGDPPKKTQPAALPAPGAVAAAAPAGVHDSVNA